jgi:hypothetical protein
MTFVLQFPQQNLSDLLSSMYFYISQENAQEVANNTSQQVANSVAQNDANIISQTLNLTTSNFKGQFSYLNIYEAVKTDLGNNSSFTGLIVNPVNQLTPSGEETNSIIINYVKDIYSTNSLSPTQLPPTQILTENGLKGFYSLTFLNDLSNNTSVLTGQRTSYKIFLYNGYTYNILVNVNVTIQCNILINTTTTVKDINGSFTSIVINNKMAQGVSTYTPSGSFDKYSGVNLTESYSTNGDWNYLYTNFDNASISGSSNNIYPYNVTN